LGGNQKENSVHEGKRLMQETQQKTDVEKNSINSLG
jgi:hypothetical protein